MLRFSGLVFFCFLMVAVVSGMASGAAASETDFDRWCRNLDSRPEARTGLFFSPLIGQELDESERRTYGLLGHTFGFQSARMPVNKKGEFKLEVTQKRLGTLMTTERKFSPSSLRLTRLHFYLSEQYQTLPPFGSVRQEESDLMLRLALRFAARGRYDLVVGVLEDLSGEFQETTAGSTASWLLPEVRDLRGNRQALIWDRPARVGEGSNDLKLFGGYYGLWLGMAIPMALDADSPEAYGIGLMAGGPAGFVLAGAATRRWDITEGRATMIELGGNLGTWQGLGWAVVRDADGAPVIGSGVVTGLAGIGAAAWLTSKYEFSEGHAALTASALPWGAWFGLVSVVIFQEDTDGGRDINRAMLIGSDALVLATGILTRNVEMSEKRVRLINLNGVIGSVMGMGFVMIAQPDDGETAMSIIGAGGIIGLVAGFNLTDNVDDDKFEGDELTAKPSIHFPQITMLPNLMTGRGVMPAVRAGISF